MRVLSYSMHAQRSDDTGWHRTGTNIKYFQNQFRNQSGQ